MKSKQVPTISVKDLVKKIINKKQVFILDVREREAFDDWKVEGGNVHIINYPFDELERNPKNLADGLPKGERLYVICAKGGSSQKAAEYLMKEGIDDVASVSGGMEAWSEHLEPIKVHEWDTGDAIYQFVRVGKGCLSYMIVSEGQAILIDTNRMITPYREFIDWMEVALTYVLDTHLHADHISGGRRLAKEYGAQYYLPEKDAEEVMYKYEPLHDGDVLTVGKRSLKVLASPGHTIGSMSFVLDDQFLFTGDILFIDSIGRPDLAGKAKDWVADLRETLYRRYRQLSSELVVLPAHFMIHEEMNKNGSVSEKLGVLYEKNHGLNIEEESSFRQAVTDNLPPQPNAHQKIRQTNMGKQVPDEGEAREMEIGPNRCAIQ
ncbi:MBL fold metallo-hydrolase [Texcoconibacillus texcoconensis]|uniref:Glyoxylase-like metal-dependent hydrolase (Beta-lactamase superfamily II) n=1 Tax=Texcoconibacillus texcoconensis TaxID=1095777 RepID=A0A840QLR7_9BACI|nr:MBL fold metallo-hydrolase [Texcoconibacillus texcoconensis]MBB5172308.1 glyoxylase-like metal-dependent hydrolase (beta-lactamase superfamily II) [Texcoconibacillus texcoconensis]